MYPSQGLTANCTSYRAVTELNEASRTVTYTDITLLRGAWAITTRVAAAWLCLAAATLPEATAQSDSTATLIVRNAAVTTLDERRPAATAIAVAGERILAVGSDSAVAAYRTADTRVIDAGGRRLIPGLNDSHIHPTRGGRFYAAELRWDGIPKLATALARVREQAARTPEGQWVRVVGGWSPYQFEEARFPTTAELDAAAGDVPTLVTYLYSPSPQTTASRSST